MNTLSYNGYLGTVNFSEKDECFYGKIEGIDGLVNFEGQSVSELKEAFHEFMWIVNHPKLGRHVVQYIIFY